MKGSTPTAGKRLEITQLLSARVRHSTNIRYHADSNSQYKSTDPIPIDRE